MEELKKNEENVNSQPLKINRVPNETAAEFKRLADESFCGDYGMTLKDLLDAKKRYLRISDDISTLIRAFNSLDARVRKLEEEKK